MRKVCHTNSFDTVTCSFLSYISYIFLLIASLSKSSNHFSAALIPSFWCRKGGRCLIFHFPYNSLQNRVLVRPVFVNSFYLYSTTFKLTCCFNSPLEWSSTLSFGVQTFKELVHVCYNLLTLRLALPSLLATYRSRCRCRRSSHKKFEETRA